MYHDLGLRFASPTINLTIPASIDFFENLAYYMKLDPVPGGYSQKGKPIILLDDIEIVGVHYHSHKELIEQWNKRKQRIVWDRIIIMTNSRFVSSSADIERFSRLPYPKILFTRESPKNSFEVYVPALEKGGDLTAYCDLLGRRHFEKHLDCVKFLNESAG